MKVVEGGMDTAMMTTLDPLSRQSLTDVIVVEGSHHQIANVVQTALSEQARYKHGDPNIRLAALRVIRARTHDSYTDL
jgi:D-aminopeptidase